MLAGLGRIKQLVCLGAWTIALAAEDDRDGRGGDLGVYLGLAALTYIHELRLLHTLQVADPLKAW